MSASRMRSLTRALAVAVLGAGPVLLAPTAVLAPADAATCTSAGGVSVVVDYRELGGGTTTACAADGGGRTADAIFASVGVGISYATRQPGFVCRVNGVPTADPCVNASPVDAYWGLWWSDGSAGSWTYSSSGVGGLTVPAGGSVGWSWKQGTGNAVPPGVAPPVAPAPTPSPSPTASPSSPTPTTGGQGNGGGGGGGKGGSNGGGDGGGTGGSGGTGGGSSPSPSPTATPSGSPTASPSGSPSGSPAESPSQSSPSDPTESPLASESPSDSRPKKAARDRSLDDESPGDSTASEDPAAADPGSESPGDSSPSAPTEAGRPAADEPAKVPAAVTWGVVALLAIAIAVSGVVARRRRGV
ncbi:hypothetical protein SFC79_19855 [Nocardioides sp. S-58]|uniref:Uncharacterized protein n=1 Tax=Nocardioides renjunii TaxID=3095075 RepID=A0ABU5KGH4_9ACTN|nr:hypothetical protein [Nocardioides sp. S-58]MDZ5664041.1 hypothetical protein [Nocardioides sp. S-58]